MLWYSATIGLAVYVAFLIFYLLRRQRLIYDLTPKEWGKYQEMGFTLFLGYLINFLPYFFVERTLFLHNYLPALVFKICLLCFLIEHIYVILKKLKQKLLLMAYKLLVVIWLFNVFYVYKTFFALTYGRTNLTVDECLNLRWKDTWDFIFS